MKNGKLIGSTLILTSLLSGSLAFACDKDDDEKPKMEYEFNLYELNNSGVEAEAELTLKGNKLKISLEASGMEAGKAHPQHIHGHGDASINARCPGMEADKDGDGLVSVGEGLPDYGPIVLPLTPFNLVDVDGSLKYEASFIVDPSTLEPLFNRAIVLHGMTVNGTYIPSLPIACGEISLDD